MRLKLAGNTNRMDDDLKSEYKTFKAMSDALSERLLDVHCRLISLYILQDIDSLNWTAEHPFFEGETSSYVMRMWWLYIQGIQDDLWNTIPSRTAKKVLKGAINESLTILTSRYGKAKAGYARNPLITADISNLLLCVYKLLPAICDIVENIFGCDIKLHDIKNIHVKCHYLFSQLILKATPLSILYKIFKEDTPQCMKRESEDTTDMDHIEPWVLFSALQDNEDIPPKMFSISSMPFMMVIRFYLSTLLSHPQPNWSLLIKVLTMHSCWTTHQILHHTINADKQVTFQPLEKCQGPRTDDDLLIETGMQEHFQELSLDKRNLSSYNFDPIRLLFTFIYIYNCYIYTGSFCPGNCSLDVCEVEEALVRILIILGNKTYIENTLIKVLEDNVAHKWSAHFDYSQIWNQKIPCWIRGLLFFTNELADKVVKSLPSNTTVQDITDVVQICLQDMAGIIDCLPEGFFIISSLIEKILPADVQPLGHSVVMQLLAISLYNKLSNNYSAAAETLCHLNEQHIGALKDIIKDVTENLPDISFSTSNTKIAVNNLFSENGGLISSRVVYNYMKNDAGWLYIKVGCTPQMIGCNLLLYKMFHIGSNSYEQLLSGKWKPNWMYFMKMPLRLTKAVIWDILSLRPEFWCSEETLSRHDLTVVNFIKSRFKPTDNGNVL